MPPKGQHHTEETKAKLRLARLGKPTGRVPPNKGKHHSDITRAKMSIAHRGATPWNKGKRKETDSRLIPKQPSKRPGDETRAKLSAINKARWQNPEYRARMSAKHKKRCNEPEWRARRSILSKSLWQDPEYAQKVWEAWKVKPNQAELQLQGLLDTYFPGKWKFVGDGQLIIGGRCPDFVNVNGKKEVIELFGTYWHPIFDVAERKEHYRQYGFKAAIIWEDEVGDEHRLVKSLKKRLRG